MTDIDSSPETHDMGHASPIMVMFVLVPLIAILATLLNFANGLRNQNPDTADTSNLISSSTLLDSTAPYFELPNLNNQNFPGHYRPGPGNSMCDLHQVRYQQSWSYSD